MTTTTASSTPTWTNLHRLSADPRKSVLPPSTHTHRPPLYRPPQKNDGGISLDEFTTSLDEADKEAAQRAMERGDAQAAEEAVSKRALPPHLHDSLVHSLSSLDLTLSLSHFLALFLSHTHSLSFPLPLHLSILYRAGFLHQKLAALLNKGPVPTPADAKVWVSSNG